MRLPLLCVALTCLGGCFDYDRLTRSWCPTDALVCEGFEDGASTPDGWTELLQNGGSQATDVGRAHVGQGSRRFRFEAREENVKQQSFLRIALTGDLAPRDVVFVRLFAWLPAVAPVEIGIAEFTQTGPPYRAVRLLRKLGSRLLRQVVTGLGGTDGVQQVTGDAWRCLEWEVHGLDAGSVSDPTPPRGATSAWVDGTAALSGTSAPTGLWPAVDAFSLGDYREGDTLDSNEPDAASEYWIDDLAIAPTRIGCEPR